MIQIKIIENSSPRELEDEVNEFIANNKFDLYDTIIDIKYNIIVVHTSDCYYSAMIMYE